MPMGIMRQTGVVSGDDGFVRAYEQKRLEIQAWKDDENKAVRDFAMEYERYLDKIVTHEQRDMERSSAQRRLEFGS